MIDYETKYNNMIGKRDFLIKKKEELSEEIKTLDVYRIDLETAQVFLQKVAQDTQSQLRYHIKDIVQLALDSIFPGEFKFDLVFEIKHGKTEAKLIFEVEGEEINPVDADGGGAVDIAAMALRIAVWSLGKTRNVICLDEPFTHLSDNLQQSGAEILRDLSKQLGIQFIVITHRTEIAEIADKAFKITQQKQGNYRVSVVKEQGE